MHSTLFSGGGWIALVCAGFADSRSSAAQMLVLRCESSWSFTASDWSSMADHVDAFPLTAVVMLGLCFQGGGSPARQAWAHGLRRAVTMMAAMVPACALAGPLSTLFPVPWAVAIYCGAMVVPSMLMMWIAEKRWPSPQAGASS